MKKNMDGKATDVPQPTALSEEKDATGSESRAPDGAQPAAPLVQIVVNLPCDECAAMDCRTCQHGCWHCRKIETQFVAEEEFDGLVGNRADDAAVGVQCAPARDGIAPVAPAPAPDANPAEDAAETNFAMAIRTARGMGVAKDDKEAARLLRIAADAGHAAAQDELGLALACGIGIDRDAAEAVRMYRMAADQGYADARYKLGWCYENGAGVAKDEKEAAHQYSIAAGLGSASARLELARCYESGRGVAKDAAHAALLYLLASEQGDDWASFYLGRCYSNGIGVDKDVATAARYYRVAARRGNDKAHIALSKCALFGTGGPKDESEAVRLFLVVDSRTKICVGGDYSHSTVRLAAEGGKEYAKRMMVLLGSL